MSFSSSFILLLLTVQLLICNGLIHHLTIRNDDRRVFKIETFGFIEGGKVSLTVHDFNLHYIHNKPVLVANATVTAPMPTSRKPTLKPVATVPNVPAKSNSSTINKTNSPPVAAKPVTATGNSTSRPGRALVTAAVAAGNASASGVVFRIGFVMRHAESESDAQEDLEAIIERNECLLDKLRERDLVLDLSNSASWRRAVLEKEIDTEGVGLYSLIFTRCQVSSTTIVSPAKPTNITSKTATISRSSPFSHPAADKILTQVFINFKLDAAFVNPGPNYLSAGDVPLPSLYLSFFFLHLVAAIVWAWVLRRDPATYGTVHRIHHMMQVLLIFKVLSLLFESIRYHYIAMFGASETWSIVYYIFATLKGIMLFTVILLIGSGYSLMKSFLNENEKRIIFAVLFLQVLDNVAMVILEETAPGSQGWLTWRDILHLVDILCCLAILLPIVWSIRHLRQAAEVDGKAQNSIAKLQLFRTFYVMVVVYIYFTRIAVYLLAATIPFYLLWLGPLATETATFLFFVITGYKFRPALNNPYLPVSTEDSEGHEYGLDDEDGLELAFPKGPLSRS